MLIKNLIKLKLIIMEANKIFKIIDELIPRELALKTDKVGYFGRRYNNLEIDEIKVMMDLLPSDDDLFKTTDLVITHHPPLFIPKTPTYVVHSNWDVIKGGANYALAEELDLKVMTTFDKRTGIGKVCPSFKTLDEIIEKSVESFGSQNIRLVNADNAEKILRKIAIVSGFGLSNTEYIRLAKERKIDLFISGDLTHKNAILAKKLDLTLMDISHHVIEMPGLIKLAERIATIGLPVELIDTGVPWEYIKTK